MRRLFVPWAIVFLLVGCTADPSATSENLTIFGRLSQLVQLAGTEQIIAHKLQANDMFVTIHAEVLQARPGEYNLIITDRETGNVRDDLTVTMLVCRPMKREPYSSEEYIFDNCENSFRIHIHKLNFTLQDGVYYSESFEWERDGWWLNELVIDDGAAEPITLTFNTEVYPQKPSSSNVFELINISLPYIVIGIFLLAVRGLRKQFTQPVGNLME